MNKRYYIAYGSNLNKKQMAYRCPTAVAVGTAIIKDYKLMFRGRQNSAVATIEPKKGASVPVAVWSIKPNDEKSLDVYENFPHLYTKKNFKIDTNYGTISAMAYIMKPGRNLGTPSKRYLNTIEVGYDDFGLEFDALYNAVSECSSKNKKHDYEHTVKKFAIQQKNGNTMICPRCGKTAMKTNLLHNCLSRRTEIYICENCGMEEALLDFYGTLDLISDWYICKNE